MGEGDAGSPGTGHRFGNAQTGFAHRTRPKLEEGFGSGPENGSGRSDAWAIRGPADQRRVEYDSMKSRDTLIRLKRFQVEEKRRRVAQIEMMIAEFDRMAVDLDREIAVRGAEGGDLGSGALRLSHLRAGRCPAPRQPPAVGPEPPRPARRRQGGTRRGLRGPEEGREPGGPGTRNADAVRDPAMIGQASQPRGLRASV